MPLDAQPQGSAPRVVVVRRGDDPPDDRVHTRDEARARRSDGSLADLLQVIAAARAGRAA